MHAAMIADIFEHAVDGADDAALAANILRRARIAVGVFISDHDGITNFVFATRLGHRFSVRAHPGHFRFNMSRFPLAQLRRFWRISGADQAIDRNELGQFFFGHALRASGALGRTK